jgi:hypothetical protein
VADFLSDQWIAALAQACADTRETSMPPAGEGAADRLVIEPAVQGVPGRGEVRYRVVFEGFGCSVEAVARDGAGRNPADVHLETDYATAVALARGAMNAQAALAAGTLRVTGDVARLAAHAAALTRFDDLFAAVRTTTAYPAA